MVIHYELDVDLKMVNIVKTIPAPHEHVNFYANILSRPHLTWSHTRYEFSLCIAWMQPICLTSSKGTYLLYPLLSQTKCYRPPISMQGKTNSTHAATFTLGLFKSTISSYIIIRFKNQSRSRTLDNTRCKCNVL